MHKLQSYFKNFTNENVSRYFLGFETLFVIGLTINKNIGNEHVQWDSVFSAVTNKKSLPVVTVNRLSNIRPYFLSPSM